MSKPRLFHVSFVIYSMNKVRHGVGESALLRIMAGVGKDCVGEVKAELRDFQNPGVLYSASIFLNADMMTGRSSCTVRQTPFVLTPKYS